MHLLRFFPVIISICFLQACQSDPTPAKPKHGYLPDSVVDIDNIGQSQPNLKKRDTLVIGKETEVTLQNESFEQRNDRFAKTVFPDFMKVTLDPMDAFPNFKTATKSAFLRMRKSEPTATKVGQKVYPRILLKSYRFASWEPLKQEFEAWVNGMEHGETTFKLGDELLSVKTPPVLVFMTDNWLVMVQWSCQYQNEDWDWNQNAFFEFAEKQGAKFTLSFTCKAGALEYIRKP